MSVVRTFWVALTAATLALALVTALSSPSGNWNTFVFGVEYHQYSDPGGWYLGGALAMSEPEMRAAGFYGHPGQPLALTLHGIARLMHGTHKFLGGRENFITYASGHLPSIIPACLFVMAIFQTIACYAVYRFARCVGVSVQAALAAALVYATCWQSLFYLARISVEAMTTIVGLAAVIACFRCTERLELGDRKGALRWAFAVGALSVLGIYTKIHLLLPLAGAIGLWMLALPVRSGWRTVPAGTRLAVLGVSAVGAAVVFVAGLKFTDWPFFFAQWFNSIPGSDVYAPAHETVAQNLGGTIGKIAESFRKAGADFFAAFVTKGQLRQSTLVELGVYILAIFGFAYEWRARAVRRSRLVFIVLAVVALAPIVLFRRGFHYWSIYIALGAPFVGAVLARVVDRTAPSNWASPGRAAATMACVLVLHAGALGCYVEAKRDDARQFDNCRAWFTALKSLKPGEKIGLLNNGGDGNQYYHIGLYFPYQHPYFTVKDSAVGRAFLSRLEQVAGGYTAESLRARNISVLLDPVPLPGGGVAWSIRWWNTSK